MSVASVRQINHDEGSSPSVPRNSGRWIINWWVDQVFIVLTPVLVVPLFFFLSSSSVGITAETISLIVASFFAAGHHLPGMMRAYGDRDLFQRFHWRFILVPPIVFAVFFPLYLYHFDSFRLITLIWATWHGLMQLYGFVRIYDLKVGSKSTVTAYWDWLMCLFWFPTAMIVSPSRMSIILELWDSLGGPLIPPPTVHRLQWGCVALSVGVLMGFTVNYVLQYVSGPRPNPIKLLMLASGIGFWWFGLVMIENVILGIAILDITHDVQYMAIAWLYNCRRVNSTPHSGKFMRFIFRRGMVVLYLGLIASYGAIGLVPVLGKDETVKTVFTGFLWTSTILHYYMDGFIWKVREPSTRNSLGLGDAATASEISHSNVSGLAHLLKWSPLIFFIGWLFFADSTSPSLTAAREKELKELYTEQFVSQPLPSNKEELSWLYSRFRHVQNTAAAIPNDRTLQKRAGIMLINFGQFDKAASIFEKQVELDSNYAEGYLMLGAIHIKKSELDAALESFGKALIHAKNLDERTKANMAIGEVYLLKNEPASAKAKFEETLRENPKLEASVDALRKRNDTSKSGY